MTFHIPENQASLQITVATARSSGGPSLIVSNWPTAWTAFPKILVVRRVGVLTTALEATAITGSTLTITGPIDGYNDAAQMVGDTIEVDPTALSITEIQAAILQRAQPIVYQDFAGHADGPLTTTQTGQTWMQGATGIGWQLAAIAGGLMVPPATNASSYPTIDLGPGALPGLTWFTMVFGVSGTTGSGAGLLISDTSPITLGGVTRIVHLIFDVNGWTVGTFTNNVLTYLGNGLYSTPLICDGSTEYLCGCKIQGNTITVYFPDGTLKRFTDTLIGTYNGRYVTFESFEPSGTHSVGFRKIAVNTSDLTRLPWTGPGFDDLWNLTADAVQNRPTLGANTFTGTQIIADPDGGIAFAQDANNQWRFFLFSSLPDNLYLQTTTDGWATATTHLAINTTNGLFTFFVGPSAPNYTAIGASSAYFVTRRDNNQTAFSIYSAAGNFQVFSNAMAEDVLAIDGSTAGATFTGSVTATSFHGDGAHVTGLNPTNLAGTPATITGSKAGNTALASVITKLVAAFPNLFSDGTS